MTTEKIIVPGKKRRGKPQKLYRLTVEHVERLLKDILTIDEITDLEHKHNFRFETFEDEIKARDFEQKHGGTVYTQVDSETSDARVYSKGWHLVNRTGTWAVVYMPPTKKQGNIRIDMHPEISHWRDNQLVDMELYEDLRERGQLQNLVARRLPDGSTQLIAGYQRYLAMRSLGKQPEHMDIKFLENVSDEEAILMAISENKTRKDLTTIEEARSFKSLANLKLTHAQIAEKTKTSETYVRDRLHLLELPTDVKHLIQAGKVPVSYSVSIRKLEKAGPQWQLALAKKIASTQYDQIDTLEKADEFVETTLAAEKKRKILIAKFGVCPKCGSANIGEDQWTREPVKLNCEACKHEWNRTTGEPWKISELRENAAELGLKVDLTKNGKAEISPEEITKIVDDRSRAIAKVEKPNPAFRSFHSVAELLAPLLQADNIQNIYVDGETITIRRVEHTKLHFKAMRKTYTTGEKSRIQVIEGWRDDDKIRERMPAVRKFEASLPRNPRFTEQRKELKDLGK